MQPTCIFLPQTNKIVPWIKQLYTHLLRWTSISFERDLNWCTNFNDSAVAKPTLQLVRGSPKQILLKFGHFCICIGVLIECGYSLYWLYR